MPSIDRAVKNETNRRYYNSHRGRLAEEARKYRKNNPEKVSVVKRKYYLLNREAVIEKSRLYNENNQDKRKAYDIKTHRERNLKRNYGIDNAGYAALFESQGGACAICMIHQSSLKRRLCVDHDHSTGKIRGLLCVPCNNVLGHGRDNTEILRSAIMYLQKGQE